MATEGDSAHSRWATKSEADADATSHVSAVGTSPIILEDMAVDAIPRPPLCDRAVGSPRSFQDKATDAVRYLVQDHSVQAETITTVATTGSPGFRALPIQLNLEAPGTRGTQGSSDLAVSWPMHGLTEEVDHLVLHARSIAAWARNEGQPLASSPPVVADITGDCATFPRLEDGRYELVLLAELGTLQAEVQTQQHGSHRKAMWVNAVASVPVRPD
eukprot:CAMPEP_0178467322 /NCGR_PEP_ID=MMETSP0689_2-20121128/52353_1 /TAXON_ID=160604 /ORGANISM="Amphidinium massartii, Strain CS-259" /LENGTH=215 /DNA_ID=CAMNT_0020094361 /DNA_START=30 /DNA_END=675 /DNA_ORIENTATION=+